MKEKFTKGPWDLLPAEESKEYLRVRGATLGGRYKIANVLDLQSHHNGSEWCKREREESIANAKLIACAPDMYEEIKRDIECLSRWIDNHGDAFPMTATWKDMRASKIELLKRVRDE